jgi:uncharacterized protein HemX
MEVYMFGRIQMYIIAFVVLSGLITGIYYAWKRQVEAEALAAYNQQQMEQLIKDQQAFQQKMSEVDAKQKAIESDMNKQNDEIVTKLKSLDEYLSATTTKKDDRPASIILKNTINQIKGGTK